MAEDVQEDCSDVRYHQRSDFQGVTAAIQNKDGHVREDKLCLRSLHSMRFAQGGQYLRRIVFKYFPESMIQNRQEFIATMRGLASLGVFTTVF